MVAEIIETFTIEVETEGVMKWQHVTVLNSYEGSLTDLLEQRFLTVKEAFQLLLDMSEVLVELGRRGIVHRSISPDNIYLRDGRFVLGGFESAVRAD